MSVPGLFINMTHSCKKFFENDGIIGRALEGFETRLQQLDMLEAVEKAIEEPHGLIVEAGPGVGKSLAYLVPSIEWAVRQDKRMVISTCTKALQNQLFIKDLPFLERTLEVDFKYSICMGSENYVCLKKAGNAYYEDLFDSKTQKREIKKINDWIKSTETGLVEDMDFVPRPAVWKKFSRESDMCKGRRCGYFGRCFYMRARDKQAGSHILVTNHSLLFTDLMSEANVLPDFHGLVLDEAHTVEDIATEHFGKEASKNGLNYLVDGIKGVVIRAQSEPSQSSEKIEDIKKGIKKLEKAVHDFFKLSETVLGEQERTVVLREEEINALYVIEALDEVTTLLSKLDKSIRKKDEDEGAPDEEYSDLVRIYASRTKRALEAIKFIFEEKEDGYVYWVDVRVTRTGVNYSFHAAPIDISRQMKSNLFERICPVVLTSATLTSEGLKGGDFAFIRSRLGLDGFRELALDSPYDYENNVLMYLPKGFPDPNSDFEEFTRRVKDDIIRMYDIMGGRIFTLFTSYRMLNKVAADLAEEREEIPLLKQGDLPRYVLLDVFKKDNSSILMGTSTFWQGVDVPGTALECVIITKLPFAVPSDPINASRIKLIQERGGNPFGEYQLPQALIMFKQGFGRLIRSHSDKGIVAILDGRIHTRSYGKSFINAVPNCRKTDDIADIKSFFGVK